MNMIKNHRFDSYKYMNILQKEVVYFIALAEVLNVSKASEVLGIQQSGLSRALQRLETDLGYKLFQRKNSGLALTFSGTHFYNAVKNTQINWENNFRKLSLESNEPTGLIKIGFHASIGQKYFPQIVKKLNSVFPQLELEAHTLSSSVVLRKTNEQELDFGIVISRIKNPELVQKKIGFDYIAAFQKDINHSP